MNNFTEPAFPSTETNEGSFNPGLSIRDYFAAKAMHQFLNDANIPTDTPDEVVTQLFNYVAKLSYKVADAMIEARKENQ